MSEYSMYPNAVSTPTPETSRFFCEILEKALANPVGVAPRWLAHAWALLANLLVNDYLHNWNYAAKEELNRAEAAMQNALAIDPKLPLAHHANGLVQRARGRHQAALAAFKEAVQQDPKFARAFAQKANQLILLGRREEALEAIQKAIDLSPNDPAIGTFYWIKGRAYFFAGRYQEAIQPLSDSIRARPTLWYNRLYLVSACALAGDHHIALAKTHLEEFNKQFGEHTIKDVKKYERPTSNEDGEIVKARSNLYLGLSKAEMKEQ